MLYIHKLHQLSPRSAELESVYLTRELREKAKLPLTQDFLAESLSVFFVSDTDKERMLQAQQLIQPTIDAIQQLVQERNSLYEMINLQRTIASLNQINPHLQRNMAYADEMSHWQHQLASTITPLFNKIPSLQRLDEKKWCDQQLQSVFEPLLRNSQFSFNAMDIVSEGQLTLINGLCESMTKGFFFHIPLEEEIKKKDFSEIKKRIPADKTAFVDMIHRNLTEIQKGIERAYEMNTRLLTLSVHLYAYVRWLRSSL